MNFRTFYNVLIGGCILALTVSCAGIGETLVTKIEDELSIVKNTIVDNTIEDKETEPVSKPAKAKPQLESANKANNLDEINKYINDLSMWVYVERVIAPCETIDEAINQDSIKIYHRVIASYNSIKFPSKTDANSLDNAIKFLLQKKTDVNLLNDDGEDALSAFLKIGSNSSKTLDAYNRDRKHYSAEELEPMVKLFIENGADIKLIDKNGVSTFERIVDFAGIDFIKPLIKSNIEINNALNVAVKHNHLELSHYLIEKGAVLNTSREEGKDAFMHAACNLDDLELFKRLVDKTSDINAIVVTNDWYSRNTLSHIIYMGQNQEQRSQKNYINKIVYLLDKGIKVDEKDWNKLGEENSLLTLALNVFRYNEGEIIFKKLLEKGANVNLKYYKKSPLFALLGDKFIYPFEPIFELLIEQGADVNCVRYDKTPLDLITPHLNSEKEEIRNKALKFSEILKSKGAKTFVELEN